MYAWPGYSSAFAKRKCDEGVCGSHNQMRASRSVLANAQIVQVLTEIFPTFPPSLTINW